MIEVPIGFVVPGDIIAKNQVFRKLIGGMGSYVDLVKGYRLTERVITKLAQDYGVRSLWIEDPAGPLEHLHAELGIDETERRRIVGSFVDRMKSLESSGIIEQKYLTETVEQVLQLVYRAVKTDTGRIRCLAQIFANVQSHDQYTWEHSVNTAIYGAVIAVAMPALLDERKSAHSAVSVDRHEMLVTNLLLHDLGKIHIPVDVLNKQAKLTEQERTMIRRHPYAGLVYIRKVNERHEQKRLPRIPAFFTRACLLHHQSFDGSGYPALRRPDGDPKPYAAGEIPIIGRIARIADVFDAVTSDRPYRTGLHPAQAMELLKRQRGRQLDPDIADLFLEMLSPFPIGSAMDLGAGVVGIVTGYSEGDKLHPVVLPYRRKVRRDGREHVESIPGALPVVLGPEASELLLSTV